MTSMTLAVILQAACLSTGANKTYAEAHRDNAETGRPLVVLVGADWCPACRDMKNSALPQVEKDGVLAKVAFAVVNTDRDGELAHKLMQGSSIPQLIMYRKTNGGWMRQSLVGSQSPGQIESFIKQALESSVIPASTVAGR
jgi:thiol-disulfide isomerase/thioredoxin